MCKIDPNLKENEYRCKDCNTLLGKMNIYEYLALDIGAKINLNRCHTCFSKVYKQAIHRLKSEQSNENHLQCSWLRS